MAITLTPALDEDDAVDADGNTYCTLAVANTYFEGRLDAEVWNTSDEERQQQALLTARDILDELSFIGLPSTTTQPLAWPRVANTPRERGQVGRGRYSAAEILGETSGLYDTRGRKWLVTEIPTPVKDAQCEIALAILTDQSWAAPDAVPDAEFWAGSVRIKAGDSKRGKVPARAERILSGLLQKGARLNRA